VRLDLLLVDHAASERDRRAGKVDVAPSEGAQLRTAGTCRGRQPDEHAEVGVELLDPTERPCERIGRWRCDLARRRRRRGRCVGRVRRDQAPLHRLGERGVEDHVHLAHRRRRERLALRSPALASASVGSSPRLIRPVSTSTISAARAWSTTLLPARVCGAATLRVTRMSRPVVSSRPAYTWICHLPGPRWRAVPLTSPTRTRPSGLRCQTRCQLA
jgi:hypothetical protein